MTFDQLANHILASPEQKIRLTPECFGISDPAELLRIWGTEHPGAGVLSESL